MAVVLNLSPEHEREIQRQAREKGMGTEDYILSLVEEAILFDGFEPIPEGDDREREESIAAIRRGLEDFEEGRYCSIEAAFVKFRAKHGSQ